MRKQIGMPVPYQGAKIILLALLKTLEGMTFESVESSVGVFPAKSVRLEV